MAPQASRNVIRIAKPLKSASSFETSHRVFAVVADEHTASAVRAGLAPLGDTLDVTLGTFRTGIRSFETGTRAQAVIVDITGAERPEPALHDLVRAAPPGVRVFVIGDNTDPGFHRLLVHELGVTEYLSKPVTRDTVRRLILPHLSGDVAEPAGARGGALVAVCGARGGAGASSIALNLAHEIMTTVQGDVALLDLHIQGGQLALMLSVRPGPGLRIGLEDAARVDGLFLDRAAIEIAPRLRLIAAEDAFNTEATVTEAGLARVLLMLQQRFSFIIADVPMPLPPAMMRVLTHARQVVAVMTPDAVSARDTRNIRQLAAGVTGVDQVITVLNRSDMKGGLEPALVEKALGRKPDMLIPDLGPRMLESVNLGIPAVKRVPALRRHLAPLVREIADVRPHPLRGSWMGRLLGR